MTTAELKTAIESLLPEDGVFAFRTFDIPATATTYGLKGGPMIPLRCLSGDLRVGILVFNFDRQPLMQSALEVPETETLDDNLENLAKCIGAIVQAAADGKPKGGSP